MRRPTMVELVDRVIPPELLGHSETRIRSRVLVVCSLAGGLLTLIGQLIRAFFIPLDSTFWLSQAVITLILGLPVIQWFTRSSRLTGGILSLTLVIAMPVIHARVDHFPAPILLFFPAVPVIVTFFVGPRFGLLSALLMAAAGAGLGMLVPTASGAVMETFLPVFISTSVIAPIMCYLLAAVYEGNRTRNEVEFLAINDKLAAAQARAEEADRAKTEFLQHMSHELRTPLNAILGYSELLSEELADGPLQDPLHDIEKIGAASRNLLGLINDLLDISKIEAGGVLFTFADFGLDELLDDLRVSVEPLVLGGANRLQIQAAVDLGGMRSDRLRMRQILVNLVGNACKFTTNGVITVRCARADASVRFEVADTGIGIEPDMLAKIFEPFVQIDGSVTRRQQGTGLGLAITRKLVEGLGGAISVVSARGQGTTFTVEVPRRPPRLEPSTR